MKYSLVYYLKNQSELFSYPQEYQTDDPIKFQNAIETAKINGYKIVSVSLKKIIAKDNYTLECEGEFDSMEAFRKAFPSAEITCIEETDNTLIVYS